MVTRVVTLVVTRLLWHPVAIVRIGDRAVANRKKTETIHLRVDTVSKATLECLAAVLETTSTQILLDLIDAKSMQVHTRKMRDEINDQISIDGRMVLKDAIKLAYDCEDPILAKLRLSYIADDALSSKDQTITSMILQHPHYFSGDTEIFSKSENLVKEGEQIPSVSLKKIYERMESLEEYASFREKNPWKTSYEAFLNLKKE